LFFTVSFLFALSGCESPAATASKPITGFDFESQALMYNTARENGTAAKITASLFFIGVFLFALVLVFSVKAAFRC
jgi:hypothetical protein